MRHRSRSRSREQASESVANHRGAMGLAREGQKGCSWKGRETKGTTTWLGRKKKEHLLLPLNEAQRAVVQLVASGRSVFLTGGAGTGKSRVLSVISRHVKQFIALTASTGTAAVLLGGQTLHSWSGIGLARGDTSDLVRMVLQDARALARWQEASLLVIDEISMISGRLLDILDMIGREARRCKTRPFGGLQLLLCGDFEQLAPMDLEEGGWAFEADCWSDAVEMVVELMVPVRLDPDECAYRSALEDVRTGMLRDSTWSFLNWLATRSREPWRSPVSLVGTNAKADKINQKELANLLESTAVEATDFLACSNRSATLPPNFKIAPTRLKLCVGALVVLTQSVTVDDQLFPNGTRCKVVSFVRVSSRLYDPRVAGVHFDPVLTPDERSYLQKHSGILPRLEPIQRSELPESRDTSVKPANEFVLYPASFEVHGGGCALQLPVRLSWALTVHRAQGSNLDAVIVHLSDLFMPGHAYVALSRCRKANDLWIEGLPPRSRNGAIVAFSPDHRVAAFYRALREAE
mmetsp:Transcript_112218/g.177448  ORF Transcript_112218/g.177448 Transcript_112218/m.177448 type:complete len:521 (+) Transcript_112218:55-1617(+)